MKRARSDTWKVHVRLLNEGVTVSRPTRAIDLKNGGFELLATPDHDPSVEEWEFPPGSIVILKERSIAEGTILLASGLFKRR